MNQISRMNKKDAENFAGQKREKTGKTHPDWAKKGETGCVLGAGGDGNGWKQVRTDRKDRKARRKSWDGLVSAAASVGAGRSPQATSAPRHAVLEWMWESAPGSEEGSVLPDFLDKSETGWCCFGAVGKIGTVMDGKFPILGTIALFGKI